MVTSISACLKWGMNLSKTQVSDPQHWIENLGNGTLTYGKADEVGLHEKKLLFSERGLEDTLENIPDQLIQSRLKKKNNNHNTRILSEGEDSRMRHKELSWHSHPSPQARISFSFCLPVFSFFQMYKWKNKRTESQNKNFHWPRKLDFAPI